jgi:hypothetical protein
VMHVGNMYKMTIMVAPVAQSFNKLPSFS